jgi:hypothetical protein
MTAIVGKHEGTRNVAAMIVVSVLCIGGTIFMLFVLVSFHRELKGKDSNLDRKPVCKTERQYGKKFQDSYLYNGVTLFRVDADEGCGTAEGRDKFARDPDRTP